MNVPLNIPRYVQKNMASKKYIRKIVKNGRNSYYINIPKEIVKEFKLKERQKLVIGKRGKGILIVDWTK